MTDTNIGDATARLAAAAEALEQTIARISASHDSLHSKVDRIIAAIDEQSAATEELERRIAALERENADLKAAADQRATESSTTARKTLAPFVSLLLTKSGVDDTISADSAVLDKALASLSVEQRVAVKAEMARAGLIA